MRVAVIGVVAALSAACAVSAAPVDFVPLSWTGGITPTERGVAYGPRAEHRADLYLSEGERGTVVYVHGGSWTFGSRENPPSVLLWLVTRGWDVVSIDYRLSGTAVFPAAVHDTSDALDWVRTAGAAAGLDTDRVLLSGWSAGANIAALAAFAANDDAFPGGATTPVDGLLAFAGAFDMTTVGLPSLESPGGWLHGVVDGRELASPVSWLDAGDPPVLAVHGVADTSIGVDQLAALASRSAEVGHESALTALEVSDPSLPAQCRGHQSWCGAPIATLEAFLAAVGPVA